jgi:hypothetical protein
MQTSLFSWNTLFAPIWPEVLMAPPYILLECNVLDSNILILNTKLVSK